jgi:hypothetical protein
MPSTPDSKNDPRDVLEIAPDIVLVARAAAEFPSLVPDAAHRPIDRQPESGAAPAMPTVDTSFRATDTSGGRKRSGWARTVLIAFTFALCSALATAAWQHSDDTQSTIGEIAPQIMSALTSWLPAQKPPATAQPDQALATDTATASPTIASSAQPQHVATAVAAAARASSGATDQVQLLESMARDVASLRQQIDELKAIVAQLKVTQDQISRDKARPPEPRLSEAKPVEPRPTKLGAPPRPLGTVVQRARPQPYPPQAAYVPPPSQPATAAPVQIAPPPSPTSHPDGDPVVRPPMPMR